MSSMLLGWCTMGFALGPPGLRVYPVLCSRHPTYSSQMDEGRAHLDLDLFLSASRICKLAPEGNNSEGELGWFGQFSGFLLLLFGDFVCLVLMFFLCFQLEPCPEVWRGVFVFWGSCGIKGRLCSSPSL